jgi:hypothetical protein
MSHVLVIRSYHVGDNERLLVWIHSIALTMLDYSMRASDDVRPY